MLVAEPPVRVPAEFMRRLLRQGMDIQAVWSIGHGAESVASEPGVTGVLVFADRPTLDRLRKCDDLHGAGLELLVVVDGDVFENTCGTQRLSGSLARWAWREVRDGEAYYDESRWAHSGDAGNVVRVRRKAYLVWARAGALQSTT